MRKILLVTRPIAPPWDEASKNFAFSLAQDLGADENLEIHLLTKGLIAELPKKIIQENIYTHSQNDFGFSQKLRLFYFLLYNAKKFDVIHLLFTPTKLNTFFVKLILSLSGARRKTKTLQTIATLREDMFSDEEIRKLTFSDLAITYSDYAKNKLEKLGIENAKRIYPGIDLEKYASAPKDPETLSKFKIQNLPAGRQGSEFIITYPGEYTRLGATDSLVEILPEIFEKIPNAKFVFACRVKNEKDAQKKADIIKKFKVAGIFDKIVFTDTFADMPKIYNMSDVVIFPVGNMQGKFDVPLAVIEAFACEKPMVISDIPILKEFANKKNSVIISHSDFDQLTEALVKLQADPSMRDVLGKTARRYVEENFNIKNVSAEYKKTYESIA